MRATHAPTYTDEQHAYLDWHNSHVQAFFYAGLFFYVLLLGLANFLSRLISAAFVRRFHTLNPSPVDQKGLATLVQLFSACVASWRKWTYRRSQLVVWVGLGNAAQLFVLLGYLALTLSIAFSGAYGHPDYQAHHCARLAYAHVPILVGLASREAGVLAWLTGFSPATLINMHRWMARNVFFLVCFHIGGRIYTNVPTINPLLPHMRYQAWGIAGFIFWSIMVFGSIRPVRRRFFKSFIFTHIAAFALSVICLSFHRPQVAPYLAATAAVYILDRIVRFASLVYFNLFRAVAPGQGPSATVEIVGTDVIKVQVSTGLAWKPGKHVYLHAPLLEAGGHPFSIASSYLPVSHRESDPKPQAGELTLVIRVHGGLTAKLYQHALRGQENEADGENGSTPVPMWPVFLEGPYGHDLLLHRYESVLLMTGGTGVTFALSCLLDLVRRARNRHLGGVKPLVTTRVTFVWSVRNSGDVDCIAQELREAIHHAPPGFLDVQVYITSAGRRLEAVDTTASSSSGSSASMLKRVPTSATLHSVEKEVLHNSNRSTETLIPRYDQPYAITFSRSTLDDLGNTPPPAPTSTESLDQVPLLSHTPPTSTTSTSLDSVVIPLHTGRPRIRDILADVVSQTPRAGSVAVGTCGPVALTDEVGAACSDMIDPGKVSRGEHRLNIMLHSEVFGW
ncbi:Ferric reductase NAD binding domain-domain containing protein [Rhodotorula toruloides]|uniref:Ferric reductase NAD binding domain-domain containing protein n=1 Tax=Rhodotorula toruloides TaxID=5286 RepID=A0A2T0AHV5_RHOTO|nr:Ferric reductase NAD binding domain-domain containing protein [Rhodotorula toruloides]